MLNSSISTQDKIGVTGSNRSADSLRVAIVGPPNSGKSALFSRFSKSYSVSANHPHTTVEPLYREVKLGGAKATVIDTPGLNSMTIQSEDEQVTRDFLLDGEYDTILFCADATRINRSLGLLAEIIELRKPVTVAINMTDEAQHKGFVIDTDILSKELGTHVIATAAASGAGLTELNLTVTKSAPLNQVTTYPAQVDEAVKELEELFPEGEKPSLAFSLLFLVEEVGSDRRLEKEYGKPLLDMAKDVREKIKKRLPGASLGIAIFNAKKRWSDLIAEAVVKGWDDKNNASGFAQKAAWASRSPVYGWPILFAIMYITYKSVAIFATVIADALDNHIFAPLVDWLEVMITSPIASEFLVGQYGIITMGLLNAIVTVVPILTVFFLILNLLEDIGYLPNLSVLANNTLSHIGLTGKASFSLALGVGCNAMATLASRMMETKKERIIASFLVALGVPCAVQLGVLIAILATAPVSALILVFAAVTITQLIAGFVLNKLLKENSNVDFILELPPLRTPIWKFTLVKTYQRVKWFLMEATPLFVLGAFIMFLLEKSGGLALIKYISEPIITTFLVLPEKATEVFILAISRRELGAAYFKSMVDSGTVDNTQIVVGVTVLALFIPCISNTIMITKELGLRWGIASNLGGVAIAIFVGGVLNAILRLFAY